MTSETPSIGTRSALRRAFREAPVLRRGLAVTVALTALGTAMQVVVPIAVQQMIDEEILTEGGIDGRGVAWRAGIALAAIAVAALAGKVAILRLGIASASGLSDLRVATFSHLHRLSILHTQSERRGSLVARVTADIATIQDFMDWGGVAMLVGSSQIMLAMGVMLAYRWQLALMVLGGVIVYALLVAWFQRLLARAHDRVRERVADSLAALGEAISGLPAVRAYGAEDATIARVEGALDRQFRAEFRTGALGAILFSSAELFAGFITAAVVGVGVWLGALEGVTAGILLAFLFLANLLVEPIQMLVETLDLAQSAGSGLRRILGVLDTAIDVPDPVDGVQLPPGPLGVDFRRVRFRYPTGPEIIGGLDVAIAPGTRVAVVGETGSGKTTFAKLATRLLEPTEGAIVIGGLPLDRITFASLRSRVAFVPQEGFLFDASIAENVRYGKPDADERQIRAAFTELGLDEWLARLPEGPDTRVGERGGNLSAGERQLVALVRAWISGPDLLVLDEATSAVDSALEVSLRNAIERLIAGRTSITVAHRLSTAEASDEILVFQEGRLVERGHHLELLDEGGAYRSLHADWTAGSSTP